MTEQDLIAARQFAQSEDLRKAIEGAGVSDRPRNLTRICSDGALCFLRG